MTTGDSSAAGRTVVLAISGMTCGGCAATVTRVLSRVPGVDHATVDLAGGLATVTGAAAADALVAAVEAAGFGGRVSESRSR
jgi:copper chaperone CopZ